MSHSFTAKPAWTGLLASLAAVGIATAIIFPLREIAPAASLGVVYLLPVLAISVFWSLGVDLFTAFLSALSFNYFHFEPTGSLAINSPENIVALMVYLVAAAVTSSLAELSRKSAKEADLRRLEADITSEMARELLGGTGVDQALSAASAKLAAQLELSWARIALGPTDPDVEVEIPLQLGSGHTAHLDLPPDIPPERLEWIENRVASGISAVLKAAVERDELMKHVIESQALRRSDVLKTALIRAVSHDLRSPLSAIVTSGSVLGEPGLSELERREMSEAVVDEAGRLSLLVTNLLDLSRLDSGAADPQTDWCALDEVIETAVDETRRRHPEVPVRIVLEDDPGLVRVDAIQIERILVNLIENAQRYSNPEPVTVTLRSDQGAASIRVVDRGPGIDDTNIERIFDPFEQVANGGPHKGSGLGLAIARGFAEANGGTVHAESLPGQGSVFTLRLPTDPEDDHGRR